MSERRTLLPTGSTALERAVDQCAPRWDALARATHPGDDAHPFKPWLAAEWALAEFAPYFASTDDLLIAGLPWLRQRGSVAAVRRALGWVGFAGAWLDQDGPWLHIDLGRTATTEELARIAHVVRASIPAHVNLYRVYYAWDLRAVTLDAAPRLDAGVLDNESGAWIELPGQAPIKASFGKRRAAVLRRPPTRQPLARAITAVRGAVWRGDLGQLDAIVLDRPLRTDAIGGGTTCRRILLPARVPPAPPLRRRVPTARGASTPSRSRAVHQRATAHHAAQLPTALPRPRGWLGPWDADPWGPSPILARSITNAP